MKRKHIPGGCYCCGCEVIDVETLPTLTIAGYNFVGWGGSPCCPCAFFVPESDQYTELCSDVFATVKIEALSSWDWLYNLLPVPRIISTFSPPCPPPESYCCNGAPSVLQTCSYFHSREVMWKFFLRYRPDTIQVCFSHQVVTCENEEPKLQWIVKVRKNIYVQGFASVGTTENFSTNCSQPPACYEVIPGKECNTSCINNTEPGCTFENLSPASCGLMSQLVGYDRVKFFDELPTSGIEVFTSDDTPENCTWEYCETELEYETQACFSISSYISCIPECICGINLNPLVEIVEQTQQIFGCLCTTCQDLNFNEGVQFTVIPSPCNISFPVCCPCDDLPSCGSYTYNALKIPCGGPLTLESEICNSSQALTELVNFENWGFFCQAPAQQLICFDSACNDFFFACPPGIEPCIRFAASCSPQDCDSSCCYGFECDGDIVSCSPKYAQAGHNWNEYTWESECTFTPASLCVPFGNVSVNFEAT